MTRRIDEHDDPASWTCERQDGDGGDPNAGDDVYADIYWAIHDAQTYNFIANVHSSEKHARLIAAAPDLLIALESAVARTEALRLYFQSQSMAEGEKQARADCALYRAAIAKAKS